MGTASSRLAGKVVVVTGAGRGIGRAIAHGCAMEQACVVLAARSTGEIQGAAAEIEAGGGRALAIAADVTRLDDMRRLFSAAREHYGGVDVVFANAGGNVDRRRLDEGDPRRWVENLELNLVGAYHTVLAAIPHLKERGGGRVILVGSGVGHTGLAGNSSYSVAKAGVWMLTKVAAEELAEFGISVNEMSPGPVRTELTRTSASTARAAGGRAAIDHPLEWVKDPADVVPLALFLAAAPDPGPSAQSFRLNRRVV